MTITGISTNVQALLTNTGYFVTVLAAPPTQANDFSGYPAAAHYYNNTASDYATVTQNRRTINYKVELYILPDKDTDEATALAEMYDLIDNVLNIFDQSIDLSDANASPAITRACDIMRAVPGELQEVDLNEGKGLVATITLACEADVSFR